MRPAGVEQTIAPPPQPRSILLALNIRQFKPPTPSFQRIAQSIRGLTLELILCYPPLTASAYTMAGRFVRASKYRECDGPTRATDELQHQFAVPALLTSDESQDTSLARIPERSSATTICTLAVMHGTPTSSR